jgi:outer membrane immunogenic protein
LGACLLIVGTPALAADLYHPTLPPAASPVYGPAPATDWHGPYAGLHIGYGWGTAFQEAPLIIGDIKMSGGFVGGQAGYNWVHPNGFLLGVEADISLSGIKGSTSDDLPFYDDTTVTHQVDLLGTVRGRVGYVMGDWMPYVTGGFAWAKATRSTVWEGAGGGSDSNSQSHHGWTAGLGVEWAFKPTWTAKLEYLYMDLGSRTYPLDISPTDPIANLKVHTLKVGVNKQF